MATPRLIRIAGVCGITGLSASQIERLVKDGLFPQPVPITAHTRGWPEDEVYAWNAERIRVRDERRHAEDRVIRATAGKRGLPRSLAGKAI